MVTSLRTACFLTLCVSTLGCPSPSAGRALLIHEGELRSAPPVSGRAYGAYLRARTALSQKPPALDTARAAVREGLRMDPESASLWELASEIEALEGQNAKAEEFAERARQLRAGEG